MTRSKPRKIPEILTENEQTKLLKQPNKRYATGLRNLAILRVLLDSGLRCGELLALERDDVDFMTGQLKVRQGKGCKDRILWLNDSALSILKSWVERRGRELENRKIGQVELLFCTLKGKALARQYIDAMLKLYAKRAGIKKRVHPHMTRHTFATDLYRKTGNLKIVQKAMGHSYIDTTSIYLHLVDGELENSLKGLRESRK